MAFQILSRKFFNQLVNGEDFSANTGVFDTYFKYNASEFCKAEYTCRFSWNSLAVVGGEWDVVGAIGANVITRTNGSFLKDGFISGDVIDYFATAGGGVTGADRTITSVDDLTMIFDGAAVGNLTDDPDAEVKGKTALRGFRFRFGLIENTATVSYNSLVDTTLQEWDAEDVGAGAVGARATGTPISGTYASTYPTSKTGSFEIELNSEVDAYTQEFIFRHEFRNIYYYTEADRSDLVLYNQPPAHLDAQNCLKYVFELKGGVTSQNPNEIKSVLESNTLGESGFFDENFNTRPAQFSVKSITYTDNATALALTNIDVDKTTDVEMIIESPTSIDLDYNHAVVPFIMALRDETEYTQNSNDWETNMLFDSKYTVRNAGAVSSSIITNLLVTAGSPASDELKINFSVSFSAAQIATIESDNVNYIIGAHVDDLNDVGVKRTAALATVGTFIKDFDVSGLFGIDEFFFYRKDMDVDIDGVTSYDGWVEDGFLFKARMYLETSLDPNILSVDTKLVAYDTVNDTFFVIDKNIDSFSTASRTGTTQNINIVKYRNFNLDINSPFNKITYFMDGTAGTQQFYEMRIPFKLQWMDYLQLNTVDGTFFDALEPFNGSNYDVSRYSEVSNYELRIIMDVVVQNADTGLVTETTTYREIFPFINANTYDLDDGLAQFSAQDIELQTVSGVTIGTQEILDGQDTKVVVTFTPTTPVALTNNYYGIISIEEFENGGVSKINELSSLETAAANNKLKPLAGESFTKVTNNGSTIVLECLIDSTQMTSYMPTTQFHISARIGLIGSALSAKMKEDGTIKQKEDGTTKRKE